MVRHLEMIGLGGDMVSQMISCDPHNRSICAGRFSLKLDGYDTLR
jgi:hypothetical protein